MIIGLPATIRAKIIIEACVGLAWLDWKSIFGTISNQKSLLAFDRASSILDFEFGVINIDATC